ncbi:MAG: Lrp/AsnC family transcriptional regulator [Deltaproteobacteria bacterium]|nr:Lrp/AsnC family transcriptional regulator [Deltaproteobacteria bacterium]
MRKSGLTQSVDALDLEIIRELELDALAGNAALGVKVGASPTTVRRRVQRLIERHMIAITTIPDPSAFGYETQATILVNVSGGKVNEVAEQLASFPNVRYIIVTTGRYDIFAWAVFRDSEDLFNFVRKGLGNIPHLAGAETMTSLKIAKSSWSLLTANNNRAVTPQTFCTFDAMQMRIMGELERNPRQTHTELAGKLGIVRHTVRRKLRTLLDSGVIQVVAIPNPLVLGYRTRAGILIKVHPGRLDAIARELTAHKSIQHVIISTGRYDIMAWAVFRNSEEMSNFVRGELGSISGIISHETVMSLRIAKGSFKLAMDDDKT